MALLKLAVLVCFVGCISAFITLSNCRRAAAARSGISMHSDSAEGASSGDSKCGPCPMAPLCSGEYREGKSGNAALGEYQSDPFTLLILSCL